jgi:Mce-associated membrane protein
VKRIRSVLMTRATVYVLSAVLAAVGGYGLWQAYELRSTPAAENLAVVDASLTAEVQAFVSQGLTQVLTFDWQDPEATTAAADQVLAGTARSDYDTLFADLEAKAPGQQLTLTAAVQSVAVKELEDDRAVVLVFLDQTSQRASDQEASIAAAQLSVTAERTDGGWTITELQPL